MTAADCEHVWIPVLGGGFECSECGARREPAASGICPITSCRRAIDDHIGVKGLQHPVCPDGMPLPGPIGPQSKNADWKPETD